MQNNSKKILSACTVASLLITSSATAVNVKAAAVTTPESTRLWGADRYETAVKVSQSAWTNSDYAVIASGEGFADALCATPLAKAKNAPILLTSKDSLDSKTLEELKRLKVKHVYIIGGQGVVSTAIENKIKSEMNLNTERIWGQNRYETSVKVAEKLGAQSKVFLASGEGYADALSAAPVAAIEGVPILLTESKTLSKETANYIKANTNITKTFVIGGYASVSDSTMSVVPGAERFSGADRYETNAAVINGFSSDFDFKNVYMALGDGPNGNEFADAITGSAVAAKNKNPLIITSREYNSTTEKLLKSKLLASSTMTVLGGEANLSNKLVEKIKAAVTGEVITPGGGGGGGISSNAQYFSTANQIKLDVNAPGDVYITGNNVTLGGKVAGTIYVNPGKDGEAILQDITAENIVVQSGADNTVSLNNVKAKKLTVDLSASGDDSVHVKSIGNTKITSTELKSNVKLDAAAGSFGTITIPQTTVPNTVKLVGIFNEPIIVKGNVNIVDDLQQYAYISTFIIPEDVTASEINLSIRHGAVANIQDRSANAVLKIGDYINVIGNILAVDATKVTSINLEVNAKIKKATLSEMGAIPTYQDRTSAVSTKLGANINSYLAKHPELNNYFSVSTTGSAITVQLNKESLNSLKSAFDRTQAQDVTVIEGKLTKVQQQLDLHSSYAKIDGGSVRDLLKKLKSPYINQVDGSLNVKEIAARIKDNTLSYEAFKNHLEEKIKETYNTNGAAPKLNVSYGEYSEEITSIIKDGKFVYNNLLSRGDNITNLLGLGDSTPGTYTVYCGTDYFTITVVGK